MIALVLDIETTGYYSLNNKTGWLKDENEILEVGYMRIDSTDLSIIDYGTIYFYKDYFKVESDAQAVHGLTREFLQQYKDDFDQNLLKLNSLFQGSAIIGKNCDRFDIPYINSFLIKHSRGAFDFQSIIANSKVNLYDGGHLIYQPVYLSVDIQKSFVEHFRYFYTLKYKEQIKNGTKPAVTAQTKGSLSDYIDVLDKWDEVNQIYDSLDKERVTRAHGALYDVVMTYVVYKTMVEKDLF